MEPGVQCNSKGTDSFFNQCQYYYKIGFQNNIFSSEEREVLKDEVRRHN